MIHSRTIVRAHDLHNKLVEVVRFSKTSFVLMGELLYKLQKNDKFLEAIGEDGSDNEEQAWDNYLKQPEIGLSRGEASRLIQIYEHFILRLGYSPDEVARVPIKNLHYLLPVAKDESVGDKEVRELFRDAGSLSQKDFRERVADVKLDNPYRTYEYLVMKKCIETGGLSKVHDIPSDLIKKTFHLND